MAWEDRDYYRDSANKAEYLGNPALFLSYSADFGRWFGVPVRLSFWLLLMMLMHYANSLRGHSVALISLTGLMFIGGLLIHDFGHRFFSRRVGGTLDSFLLWPMGGLNFPTLPPDSKSNLVGYGGGIFAHLIVGGAALLALLPMEGAGVLRSMRLNPLLVPYFYIPLENIFTPRGLLREIVLINGLLILDNLLPFYWFDGAYLLEAALRPSLGLSKAVRVTCVAGMVIAPLGVLYAIKAGDIIVIIFWVFCFAGSFNKFRAEVGPFGDGGFRSIFARPADESPRRKPRWPDKSAVKKAAAARRDQEQIDEILAKVHAQGMQSLNWMEKRALRKATERQRNR